MKFRFRKSFSIIPGILRWTVSKRGTSLNLNLGIFSKSWGTRQNTTTLDMPGTSGIFWRKEQRKSQAKKSVGVDHDDDSPRLVQPASLKLFVVALIVQALVYLSVHAAGGCDTKISRILITVLGLQLVVYTAVRVAKRVGSGLNFLLVAALIAAGWLVARSFVC